MDIKTYKQVNVKDAAENINIQIETQWTKCVLCQIETNEPTSCPVKSMRVDKCIGYHTLAENIKAFDEIGDIPLGIDVQRINDGTGIYETLLKHQAGRHRSCLGQAKGGTSTKAKT